MEIALRRHLEGVADVSISQHQQTAAVTFVPGTRAFSAAAFRSAVGEAKVEVVSLEMDTCGTISAGRLYWERAFVAPGLVVVGPTPTDGLVCVTGWLNEEVMPYALHVTSVTYGSVGSQVYTGASDGLR